MDPVLFPLFVDLRGRLVLVVGGGVVAARKVAALLATGARIRVVAPALGDALRAEAAAGRIEHHVGEFEESLLDDAWLAIAATDDDDVNRLVAAAAEARRVWVNVVDDARTSSVHVPARVERGPLQIAISSGGGAPMLARHLREQLEAQFDPSLARLAQLLTQTRGRIRARYPRLGERRDFFEKLLSGALPSLLRNGQDDAAHALLEDCLTATPKRRVGRVALVGAGPGDPGLLTLRALRLLNQADVIVHDRLVSAQVLQLARRDAELIDVGKRCAGASATQDEINAQLRALACSGKRVVRLKGGDCLVFGRGGEEIEYLRAHGIEYEIVPGVTAALACAAYAGIPLTHRDHSHSVTLMSAQHRDDAGPTRKGTDASGTIVVYMGVAALARTRDRLLAQGRDATTPFALVENGSRPEQRVIIGTLGNLVERAREHSVCAPALLIVGAVAALAERLHWFGAAPLMTRGAALATAA